METPARRYVQYSIARRRIRDGDLLLWRPTSFHGWLIARLTGSEHCHASKAAWVPISLTRSVLVALETAEGKGGTVTPLRDQVERYPGRINVYETNPDNRWPEYDRAASSEWLWRHIPGRRYGLWALVRLALTHMFGLRLFVQPDRDDTTNGTKPPHCSGACSMADRIGGGVDPVNGRADNATAPGDLERSPFYRYRFTLIPDDWAEDSK